MDDRDLDLIIVESLEDPTTRERTLEAINEDKDVHASCFRFILAVTFGAKFASCDDERIYVAKFTYEHIRINPLDIISSNLGIRGTAEQCLVSLAFFEDYMQQRSEKVYSPTTKFYHNLGIKLFDACNEWAVAMNFDRWIELLATNINTKTVPEYMLPSISIVKNPIYVCEYDKNGKPKHENPNALNKYTFTDTKGIKKEHTILPKYDN